VGPGRSGGPGRWQQVAQAAVNSGLPYAWAMSREIPFVTVPRARPRSTPKGRQVRPEHHAEVVAATGGLPLRRELLIEHLHRLNDAIGALRKGHLAALAGLLKMAQAEVFEVASFYHHFALVDDETEVAPLVLRVCTSLPCALAGSEALLAELWAKYRHDDDSHGVRIEAAPCIGRCHQAPAACVGQHAFGPATAGDVCALAEAGNTGPPPLSHTDFAAYRAAGGYRLVAACLKGERDADALIAELEASGLRGLGGAGFPTARKWRIVRAQRGPRVLAANLDEGEVGTFKDYHCLATDPHRFLEGALIAAWAVGAEEIYLYLRDEYHDVRVMLEHQLATLRDAIPGLPPIRLRRGAGAYICGEESAMIESIEGKRGLPRLRPPYVAEKGVFGRPTLVQNIETLWWVRDILERGGAWFASFGRRGRSGLRRFSISGRVNRPGVALAPAGSTVRELVDEHAGGLPDGHRLYAYLPGGASGGILPASMADLPLDFDTLAEHGCFVGSMAVIVLTESAHHRDLARDAALSLMRFFKHESCGQCTPCREGTMQAVGLLQSPAWDAGLLRDLSRVMRDASICGLGQAAPVPVDCVMRYFPHEVGL
jgi:formate dehydrogenase beta subunit